MSSEVVDEVAAFFPLVAGFLAGVLVSPPICCANVPATIVDSKQKVSVSCNKFLDLVGNPKLSRAKVVCVCMCA